MARKRKELLEGKQFGEWTVIEYIGNCKYRCRCSCGTERVLKAYALTHGDTKSCGHNTTAFKDITGKQFGELKALRYLGNDTWECKCSCGKTYNASGWSLRNEKTTSCGHSQLTSLVGYQFGDWTVIEYLGSGKVKCRCSCGKESIIQSNILKAGLSKSCGHNKVIDLTGKHFGEWVVLRYIGNSKWLCRCSCGTEAEVFGHNLRNGTSTSCGCKTTERFKKSMLERYGVESFAKFNTDRTEEQLRMINSRENIIKAIESNFSVKPNTHELSLLLGINETNTLKIIHKHKIEDYVELGIGKVSSYEKEIYDTFPFGIKSDRSILNGYEIDIYYPDYKLGIEINGNYWHSEILKDIDYHQKKTINAAKKGIQLIHVFEYEWTDKEKRNKIIKLLELKLHPSKNRKIAARNCSIYNLNKEDTKEFLNKYHLQGYVNSEVNIGLAYKDEIIGVMTFNKPRFNTNYQWELIRLAFKFNTVVMGGIEKLFKYFIKEYNPLNIVSYCDIAKFNGNSYIKLGFKPIEITKPNYVWFNNTSGKVVTRYQSMKHKLIEQDNKLNNMTEIQIMQDNGFIRIFDSGNLRLVWEAK